MNRRYVHSFYSYFRLLNSDFLSKSAPQWTDNFKLSTWNSKLFFMADSWKLRCSCLIYQALRRQAQGIVWHHPKAPVNRHAANCYFHSRGNQVVECSSMKNSGFRISAAADSGMTLLMACKGSRAWSVFTDGWPLIAFNDRHRGKKSS